MYIENYFPLTPTFHWLFILPFLLF